MWWHTRRNHISSFLRNGRVSLNRRGRQFSRLLAAEVCASAVVMLEVWRLLATHSIRQFPLHFPSHASPCAITFQLDSTSGIVCPGTVSSGKICFRITGRTSKCRYTGVFHFVGDKKCEFCCVQSSPLQIPAPLFFPLRIADCMRNEVVWIVIPSQCL